MKKIYFALATLLLSSGLFAQPVRNWGTYYGETGLDNGNSVAVDASGNVYMAGSTTSTAAISTVGSHQPAFGGGTSDAFLAKFNSAGVLQWATYYGGTGDETGYSVALDAGGNVYLTGYTSSTTAISTVGSQQAAFGGGSFDAFLVQFNSAGVRQWATYYGGPNDDRGNAVSIDVTSGNIYLGGYTTSTSSISTVGSHQAAYGGGPADGFLVQFNTLGVRQWATYYGGPSNDDIRSVAFDGTGNVYAVGPTLSTTAISTVGSHQATYGGGTYDAYLVKFNSSGVRQWATYYGGTTIDFGYGVAVDPSNNIYLSGITGSSTAISTVGSHQASFGGGTFDGFLAKFNTAGVRQWGTYYGGTGIENEAFVTVDITGKIYLFGQTASANAISTVGSHQPANGGGTSDAFAVQFNNAGVRQWGTYYGGTTADVGKSMAVDIAGNTYLTGSSNSASGISTVGSWQPTFGGGSNDAFLVQLFSCASPVQPGTISGPTTVCSGTTNTYSITAVGGATSYTWVLPGGWTGTSTTTSINATASATSGNITVTANNACGSSTPQTLAVTVNSIPATPGTISGPTTVCQGSTNPYSISVVSGATSYTWVLPGGWTGTSSTNSITATASATSGNITVTANNACGSSPARTLAVTVTPIPATPGTITGPTAICQNSTNTYSISAVSGATSYTWVLPGGWTGTSTTTSINATASATGGNITVTANNSCGSSAVQTLAVTVNPVPATPGVITGPTTICAGTTNTYSISAVSGATSYTWVLPGGWTGTSTTTSINATASSTSGNVTVTANNACGSSGVRTLAVTVNSIPATPGTISGPTTVCSGATNTYSVTAVSGATSYTWVLPGGWTGTSTTNSISATASSTSGNITVTANNTCGSSGVRTLAVTVNTIPTTPGTISGPVTVCNGSTNTYSITAVSGATSYTWVLPGGWTGTSTTNSINATASATSGNITVTANNTCGSSAAQTLAVSVNNIGTSMMSTPASCNGSCNGDAMVMATGTGPFTYSWNNAQTTQTATGLCAGNYTVQVTGAGGCTATANVTVTQPTAVSAGASATPNTICAGNCATLNIGTVSGGSAPYTYMWTPGNLTGSSVSVCPTSTTCYTLSVTDANGCTATASTCVTVNPLPVVTYNEVVTNMCSNWPAQTLTPGSPSGGTYSGTAVTGNTFDPAVSGVGTFTITYTYTDVNGCTNFATSQINVGLCTGIKDLMHDLSLWMNPNPVHTKLTVGVTPSSSTGTPKMITIYDMLGKVMYCKQVSDYSNEIDVNEFPAGVYILEMKTDQRVIKGKFVKE